MCLENQFMFNSIKGRGDRSSIYLLSIAPICCTIYSIIYVDPGGPAVIILSTGSEVCRFKPGQGQWIFSERENPEYDFLQKESKAVGPMS